MPFVDESGKPVQLSPDEEASFWKQNPQAPAPGTLLDSDGKPVNPLSDLSAQDLAALATQHKEQFNLVQAFNSDPAAQKDPAVVQKVADAFHILRQQPWYQGITPGGVVKNAVGAVTGLGRFAAATTGGLINSAEAAVNSLSNAAPARTQEAVGATQEALGETAASAESGAVGLFHSLGKLASAAGRGLGLSKALEDYTTEDKVKALFDAAANDTQTSRIASGQGASGLAQLTSGGRELDAESVSKMQDPFSWYAFGGLFKGAGALIPKVGTGVLSSAGQAAAKIAGTAGIELPARAAGVAADVASKAAPAVGGVAGAVGGGHLIPIPIVGHALGALEGATRGAEFARKFVPPIQSRLAAAADFGKQVAGTAPMRSAYAQAVRDVAETAPAAAAEVGKGVALDALMAAGGDTPQEREAAVGLGTVFGALGAATLTGRHVISGQIIAPREVNVNAPVPANASYPALDALHREQFPNLAPGQRVRANAVRSFLSGANPNVDFFVTGDAPPEKVASALESAGVSPELARTSSEQDGATIKIPGGKTIIIAKEPTSAPHEAFHGIEDVLGEGTMRELDDAVKQQYANQWQDFGRYYASRLAGQDPGPVWRDVILNATGTGRAAAIEKLWRQTALDYASEAHRTGSPMPTENEIKAQVQNSFANSGENWNQVLTPEEAQRAADSYVAREQLAENFDAWFKHAGPTLEPGKQMPERIARILGTAFSALGINPLQGRETDLRVTPSLEIINRLREGVKPLLPGDIKPAGSGLPATSTPQTARAPSTPESAHEIAAQAPDAPAEGGTQTQRAVAETLANTLAAGQGARLVYRSAPGEPAGAPAQSRAVRRTIIEYSRTMPDAMKPLFQKLFFPWRADRQQNGEITWGGWTPEVLAANANRVAQWAAEGGHAAAIPYALDTAGRTFTPGAWMALHNDLQTFVNNQLAGRTGSGVPLVVPENIRAAGAYVPELGAQAEGTLDQRRADFISMLFGTGQLPKTARISNRGLGLPLSIAGEGVSEATIPGRTQPPITPRGTFAGERAQQLGIEGRQIMEVNPLRAELEKLGGLPKMLESYQNLNLRNILSAEAAPEQPRFGANTLTLSAGFKPSEDPRAVKMAAVRDEESGRKFEGPMHAMALMDYLKWKHPERDEDTLALDAWNSHPGVTEGFTTNEGEFLTREQAFQRAQELKQYVARKGDDGSLESQAFERQQKLQKAGYRLDEVAGQFKPGSNADIQDIAKKYSEEADLTYAPRNEAKPVNEELAKRIADWYAEAKHEPDNPAVQKSYDAFAEETRDQWSALRDAGYTMEPWTGKGEPYKTSAEMTQDVRDNKHLWFLPTAEAFGAGEQGISHPLLEPTHVEVNGRPLVMNDIFRAVHDVFGHAKEGFEFGPKGEYNAYLTHAEMYSPAARPAMAAETLAQNSWVNFGKHLRDAEGRIAKKGEPGFVPAPERPFAEQKATVLPKNLMRVERAQFVPQEVDERLLKRPSLGLYWTDFPGLVHPDLSSEANRGLPPSATVKELQEAGFKSIAINESGSFHDYDNSPLFLKNTEGEFPLTEKGLRDASDKAAKMWEEASDAAWQDLYGDRSYTPPVIHSPELKLVQNKLSEVRDSVEKLENRLATASAKDIPAIREELDALDDRENDLIQQENKLRQSGQFTPRKSKQDYLFKETPGSLFSKAWILPDGKPVQLGGQWHHEWINDNPEVAKKYGLKATTSGEENRVDALKKGFARINYARNQGTLTVEARAQDWPKLSPSVREMVKQNLSKIDNMDVHLLDNGAKKIVDQDGVALHTYDSDERMDHLPLISEPSSTTTTSAQASAERGQFSPQEPSQEEFLAAAQKRAQDFRKRAEALRPAFIAAKAGIEARPATSTQTEYEHADSQFHLAESDARWAEVIAEELGKRAMRSPAWRAQDREAAQFKPSLTSPEPEEFKDIRTLPAALAKPNWAILTGTEESKGLGTAPANVAANEALKKELTKAGFDPIPVQGNYKGVDQGQNFLVTGITPKEALEWGKKYNQESVLTPDGLYYQDGSVHPVEPTEHYFGDEAKGQDYYSQVEGGPAFSMGIDFSTKMSPKEARKAFEVRGPVTAGVTNPLAARGRQREAEESRALSLQHVLDNPDMEGFAQTVVEKIKTIPGFKNISAKNIPKALHEIAGRMAQNIKFLYGRATEENRALWRTWYDLANTMTKEWGADFGHHPDIIAAVNARLSPQTDWYNNVTLTRAVLETFRKNPEFTPEARSFAKAKMKLIKDAGNRKRMLGELAGIKDGQKLSELNDLQAGIGIRAVNETTRSLLTHDHTGKLTGDFTGWGKPWDDLRSVVSILRNPSQENVNRELGNNHKVRSFYNNHVAPESDAWTTVDTHAAAAATLMPYGSKDARIKDVFGSPKHKGSGYNGTYFLYQHAYEQVAKELGILPRELQSIVWEQMRHELTPEAKRSLQNDKFAPILKIHKAIDAGTMTAAEGREAIAEEFARHAVRKAERDQQELDIQPRK